MVNKKAKTINLKSNSNKEFFLIHGYTGSPTDFSELPYILHKRFNANVKVIRLTGHGTKIKDLDDIYFKDFMEQIESELRKDINKGRKIILGGISFGAQVALILAAKYHINGVFSFSPPYKLKFPLNIKGLHLLEKVSKYYKYIKKKRNYSEKILRKNSFSYDSMHINALKIVKEANNYLEEKLKNITCPILMMHSLHDQLGDYKAVFDIEKNVSSNLVKIRILKEGPHNILYSKNQEVIFQEVINFVNENNLWNRR